MDNIRNSSNNNIISTRYECSRKRNYLNNASYFFSKTITRSNNIISLTSSTFSRQEIFSRKNNFTRNNNYATLRLRTKIFVFFLTFFEFFHVIITKQRIIVIFL